MTFHKWRYYLLLSSIVSSLFSHTNGAQHSTENNATIEDLQLHQIVSIRESLLPQEMLESDVVELLQDTVLASDAELPARIAALALICERSQLPELDRCIESIQTLVVRWRGSKTLLQTDYSSIPVIVNNFLMNSVNWLWDRIEDHDSLFELYFQIYKTLGNRYSYIRLACCKQISDSPEDLATKQEYLVRFIRERTGNPAPKTFHKLVNEEIVERLRTIAFEEPVGPRGYNVGAIDLLAEYGDQQTADQLRKWASLRGFEKSAIERPGGYVWMIEGQHDPKILLQHIKSDEWINHQTRKWAVEKCIKVGVSTESIRAALLEHRKAAGRDNRLWNDLRRLKVFARNAGILDKDDLADVVEQNKRPTP